MKLRCLFVSTSLYSAVAARLFDIGAEYLARPRPGSQIEAVDIITKNQAREGNIVLTGFVNEYTGNVDIVAGGGIVATFTSPKASRLAKSEKRVPHKADGTGQTDKRRFRRVCRQYCKLRFINPAFTCPESHRQMQKLARFHRR